MDKNNWGDFAQNIDQYARHLDLSDEDLKNVRAHVNDAGSGDAEKQKVSNEALSQMAGRISGHPNFNGEMASALGISGGDRAKSGPGGGMSGGSTMA